MITRDLLLEFVEQDPDVSDWWGGTPEEFAEAPDCDVIATRFANYLADHGIVSRVVKVTMHSPYDDMLGDHYFTVIQGIAVDWTARQFHNVFVSPAGDRLDVDQIPSPLLFLWPGPYPLPTLVAQ